MEFHEVVNIWPHMQSDEFSRLVEDIKAHGLREPIWTYQNNIIDGRHRYLACLEAGAVPRYREWDGNGSLVLFVVSLNQHRRHLDASQKAFVAVEIEKHLAVEARERMWAGVKADPVRFIEQGPGRSSVLAGESVGVGKDYVIAAKKISEQAPELKALVFERRINLIDAKRLAKEPESIREAAISHLLDGNVKNINEGRSLAKHEERQQQEPIRMLPKSVQLYHGDFYEEVKKVADGSIDMILTDPPYNVASERIFTFEDRSAITRDFGGWDKYSHEEFLAQQKLWVREWKRILRKNGTGYAFTAERYLSFLRMALLDEGLHFKAVIHWCKSNPGPQIIKTNFRSSVECIAFFTKGEGRHTFNWQGENEMRNWIELPICQGNERLVDAKGHTLHPTQKPEKLLQHFIKISSNAGDTVFDGFCGVGSTASACLKLGRRFIGIEQDATFFEAMQKRLA